MALALGDLLGRTMVPLGTLANQSLIATGTFTIFTVGAPQTPRFSAVAAIVLTSPIGIVGPVTASFGSGATATDYVASASLTLPAPTDTVILPPSTSQVAGALWLAYAIGTAFNFKITVAATAGTMTVIALGFAE